MMIRVYEVADEDRVVELWRTCGLIVPWNDPKQEILRKLAVQPELFLVGVTDERIVATVMAGYDGHRGWLYSLAVTPDLQRQGLGRQIVEAAVARLTNLGCRKVNLQVRASNTQVIDFYRKLGFEVEELISMGKRF